MGTRPSIITLGAGVRYDTATLNTNFQNLQVHFDTVLGLDGTSGSNNTIAGDIDFNGFAIRNASIGTLAGNLDLNNFKIINLAPGASSGDAINKGQLDAASTLLTIDASTSTYTSAGTGAVARTISSKLQETVSVTDFGAIGDGVTDDTAAIQAAMDYAKVTPSVGTLHIPASTYLITTLDYGAPTSSQRYNIKGDGKNKTKLLKTDATAEAMLTISSSSATFFIGEVKFSGFRMEGQVATTTACILSYAMANCHFEDVWLEKAVVCWQDFGAISCVWDRCILNAGQFGFRSEWWNSAISAGDTNSNDMNNCTLTNNTKWGFWFDDGREFNLRGGRIEGNGQLETITGITKANPAVVTTTDTHGYTTGDEVMIVAVSGMTEINFETSVITVLTTTTFELDTINSSAYTTYTGDGNVLGPDFGGVFVGQAAGGRIGTQNSLGINRVLDGAVVGYGRGVSVQDIWFESNSGIADIMFSGGANMATRCYFRTGSTFNRHDIRWVNGTTSINGTDHSVDKAEVIKEESTAQVGSFIIGSKLVNGESDIAVDFGSTTVLAVEAKSVGQVLHVQDKTAGNGGTSLVGTNTRILTVATHNSITGASLASNQVTLPAGTYELDGFALGYKAERHQCYVYDTTGAATLLIGSSSFSPSAAAINNITTVRGIITLTATSVLELRHYFQRAEATTGLGLGVVSGEGELHSELFIRRLA